MTMTTSENGSNGLNELDECRVCAHTRLWHDNNSPRHPFDDGSGASTAWLKPRHARDPQRGMNVPQRGPERPSWPIDPVLRQALMDKGVLTPQDLRDAEEKIRAVSAMFEGRSQWSAHEGVNSDSSTEIDKTSTEP